MTIIPGPIGFGLAVGNALMKASQGSAVPVYKGGNSATSVPSKPAGGGGGVDPNAFARAAERRALARERAAKKAASKRFKDQAQTLQKQANALKKALDGGYREALDLRLSNVDLLQRQQDESLLQSYERRAGSLEGADEDNRKAESDSSYQNLANRARERSNAMSEAMMQGAGESDVLRTQLMSLRNWNANQSEINRSFFDGLRSINTSLTDLNVDTRTGRLNIESQANADRDQYWTQFYNQMADSNTQLGNIYGQQAELYGMANEQVKSKATQKSQKSKSNASGKAFQEAAKYATSAWENPGASEELQNWEGREQFIGNLNNTILSGQAETGTTQKRPEGASLRSW